MNRPDERTTELLAQVVERYMYHSSVAAQNRPIVSQIAADMVEVELAELWMCTQIW